MDDVLNLVVGVRYEGSQIQWRYVNNETGRLNSKDMLNDWFPSVSFTYSMPSGKDYLTLDYARSISRPTMSAYDPVSFHESDNIFTVGASHLLPEFENSLSLTQTINNKHTISASYIWNNNMYDNLYQTQDGILYITSGNYGSMQKFNIYADTKFMIVDKWLGATLSANVNYVDYNHSEFGRTKNWNGRLSAKLMTWLPKRWAIEISGSYDTPHMTPIEKYSGDWNVNTTVSKLFGKRIALGLTGGYLLYNKNLTVTSRQPGIDYRNFYRMPRQRVTLTLVYNFGSVEPNYVKRVKVNQDAKSRSVGK